MPEVAFLPTEAPDELGSMNAQELVDLRYGLEQERAALASAERAKKKELEAVDYLLWEYHEANPEVSEIHGDTAKVKWSEETYYNTEAGRKEEIRDRLFEEGHQHLMTWHLNRAATEEFIALNGPLPGVESYVKQKVSCRKL